MSIVYNYEEYLNPVSMSSLCVSCCL